VPSGDRLLMSSTSRSDWIDPDDARWTRLLSVIEHDVYHLPAYSQLDLNLDEGSALAYLFEDARGSFLLPLRIRAIQGTDWRDATSPYGYPGPLVTVHTGVDPGGFLHDAVREMQSFFYDDGVVSAFCRMHPLLHHPMEPFHSVGTLVRHGHTVSINLASSDEELWANLRSNHKRGIKKARKAGAIFRHEQEWQAYGDFVRMYGDTMRRHQAAESYFFPDRYFHFLRDHMSNVFSLLTITYDDKVISAGLFSECNGLVEYHLSGTDDDYLHLQPLKLLIHEASKWARDRGNHTLHLGGGLSGAEDSLLNYKLGFSKVTSEFFTWRLVVNPSVYESLTTSRSRRVGGEGPVDDDYFPSYRHPCD
jgi:hypothetical protein